MTPTQGVEPIQNRKDADELQPLAGLIARYLQEDDFATRKEFLPEIERLSRGEVESILQSFAFIRPWRNPESPSGRYSDELVGGAAGSVAYVVPSDYDTAQEWPVWICLGASNETPEESIAAMSRFLPGLAGEALLISPERNPLSGFTQAIEAPDDLNHLIVGIRRRFHVDTDRVFLFGRLEGGNAAWHLAMFNPEFFAGVVIVSGCPQVFYPSKVYSFLLANAKNVPVISFFAKADSPMPGSDRISLYNSVIADHAIRLNLPIKSLPLQDANERVFSGADLLEVTRLFRNQRSPAAHTISHWFRFPDQGSSSWIAMTQFAGDVWDEDQFSALAAGGAGKGDFVTEVMKEKMGYLGGAIEGQRLTVTTKHCAEIQIRLPLGALNVAEPIELYCNGTRRFSGKVQPSIKTLLENLRRTFDFKRPVIAEMTISIERP